MGIIKSLKFLKNMQRLSVFGLFIFRTSKFANQTKEIYPKY